MVMKIFIIKINETFRLESNVARQKPTIQNGSKSLYSKIPRNLLE